MKPIIKNLSNNCDELFSRGDYLYFSQFQTPQKYYVYSKVSGLSEIGKDSYFTQKFSLNFNKILPYLEGADETGHILPNGEVLTCGYRNFYFQWFDKDGSLIQRKEDIGFDSIYDFDVDSSNNIWYVIPTHDYLGVFSLKENRELNLLKELNDSHTFSMPESVKIYHEYVYVSDMGNHRIIKIALQNKVLEEYLHFDEPVFDYIQINNTEVVLLKSGLYLLVSNQ